MDRLTLLEVFRVGILIPAARLAQWFSQWRFSRISLFSLVSPRLFVTADALSTSLHTHSHHVHSRFSYIRLTIQFILIHIVLYTYNIVSSASWIMSHLRLEISAHIFLMSVLVHCRKFSTQNSNMRNNAAHTRNSLHCNDMLDSWPLPRTWARYIVLAHVVLGIGHQSNHWPRGRNSALLNCHVFFTSSSTTSSSKWTTSKGNIRKIQV